jgi:exodeoxyribonuclease VII large subunit
VSDFYNQVRGALREAFPDEVWVTGEIRKVTDSRGHHYLELADHFEGPVRPTPYASAAARGGPPNRGANATLEVACWARDWPVVAYDLAAVGVELVPGLVVRVRGKVAVWEGGSKLRFSMTALDVEALVGGIAAARRRLLGALAAEDLLEANRRLAPPLVPLRIGLVTSLGSEAYGDFTGQLERSGYVFDLRFEPSIVQGPEAPRRIAGALRRLAAFEPHVVVLVRGGGAKGDLAAFDSELVARAIALAPFPVWTGIGHTGDRSVADEVAQRSLVTPTQCGEAVVAAVGTYLEGVDRRARRLAQRVGARLDEASRELARCSSATGRAARENLERSHLALRAAETRIGNAALVAIERSHGQLINRAQRLAAPVSRQIAVEGQRVAHRRELLALLDPQRQLERGWSLTRDERGSIVRSSASLRRGETITTTFAEGSATSVLDEIRSAGASSEEGNR